MLRCFRRNEVTEVKGERMREIGIAHIAQRSSATHLNCGRKNREGHETKCRGGQDDQYVKRQFHERPRLRLISNWYKI